MSEPDLPPKRSTRHSAAKKFDLLPNPFDMLGFVCRNRQKPVAKLRILHFARVLVVAFNMLAFFNVALTQDFKGSIRCARRKAEKPAPPIRPTTIAARHVVLPHE